MDELIKPISILILVVSGVRYILSDSDHIVHDKAKESAANVVVGLVII